MLSWKEYIKRGIVRRTSLDKNLILSLIKTSNEGLEFFKKDIPNEKNSKVLFKNYYDFLRERFARLLLFQKNIKFISMKL